MTNLHIRHFNTSSKQLLIQFNVQLDNDWRKVFNVRPDDVHGQFCDMT